MSPLKTMMTASIRANARAAAGAVRGTSETEDIHRCQKLALSRITPSWASADRMLLQTRGEGDSSGNSLAVSRINSRSSRSERQDEHRSAWRQASRLTPPSRYSDKHALNSWHPKLPACFCRSSAMALLLLSHLSHNLCRGSLALLTLTLLEPFAQLQTGLVELRLRVADGAIHNFGDFIMFIAFYIVQYEDGPVTWRKFRNGAV